MPKQIPAANENPFTEVLQQTEDLSLNINRLQRIEQSLHHIVDQASQWATAIESPTFAHILNFYRTPEQFFEPPPVPEFLDNPWPELITTAIQEPSDDNCFNAVAAISVYLQQYHTSKHRRKRGAIFFSTLQHLTTLHQQHPRTRSSVNFANAMARVPFQNFVPAPTYAPVMGSAAHHAINRTYSTMCPSYPHITVEHIDSAGRPTVDTHNRALLQTAQNLANLAISTPGSDLDLNSYKVIHLENFAAQHSAQFEEDYLEYCDEHAMPHLYPKSVLYNHDLTQVSAASILQAADLIIQKYPAYPDIQLPNLTTPFQVQDYYQAIQNTLPPILKPNRHDHSAAPVNNIKSLLAALPQRYSPPINPVPEIHPRTLDTMRILATVATAHAIKAAANLNDRHWLKLLTIAAAGYAVHLNRGQRRDFEKLHSSQEVLQARLNCIEDASLFTMALPDWAFPNTSREALIKKDVVRLGHLNKT